MEQQMESLLQKLLQKTIELQQLVAQEETDAEEWNALLDERERIIKEIDVRVSHGEAISEEDMKRYLAKAFHIQQQLIPQMESKRQGIQKQLSAIQKTKLARQSYYENIPNGYGAFFDRKK